MTIRSFLLQLTCVAALSSIAYHKPLDAAIDFVKEEIGSPQNLSILVPFNDTWLLVLENDVILEARKPPLEWRTFWEWWKGEAHQQPDAKFFFDISLWSTPTAVQLYDYKYNAEAASRIFGNQVGNLATYYPYLLLNVRTDELLFCRILKPAEFIAITRQYALAQQEQGRQAGLAHGLQTGYKRGYNVGFEKGYRARTNAEQISNLDGAYRRGYRNGYSDSQKSEVQQKSKTCREDEGRMTDTINGTLSGIKSNFNENVKPEVKAGYKSIKNKIKSTLKTTNENLKTKTNTVNNGDSTVNNAGNTVTNTNADTEAYTNGNQENNAPEEQ